MIEFFSRKTQMPELVTAVLEGSAWAGAGLVTAVLEGDKEVPGLVLASIVYKSCSR